MRAIVTVRLISDWYETPVMKLNMCIRYDSRHRDILACHRVSKNNSQVDESENHVSSSVPDSRTPRHYAISYAFNNILRCKQPSKQLSKEARWTNTFVHSFNEQCSMRNLFNVLFLIDDEFNRNFCMIFFKY